MTLAKEIIAGGTFKLRKRTTNKTNITNLFLVVVHLSRVNMAIACQCQRHIHMKNNMLSASSQETAHDRTEAKGGFDSTLHLPRVGTPRAETKGGDGSAIAQSTLN
jgi:hypothetical protein